MRERIVAYPSQYMAQQYEPHDLIKQALASLSLQGKLSSFEQNEVDDACIINALGNPETLAALPTILGACIAIGKTADFIVKFQAAMKHRAEVRAIGGSLHELMASRL